MSNKNIAMSAITNMALPVRAQNDVSKVAIERGFTSRYWSTWSQIRRGLNGVVKPGETPVETHLDISTVVPFSSLPKEVQSEVLRKYPPYFTTSIGILSAGYKWNSIGAARLKSVLQLDDFRSLWVEREFAVVLAGGQAIPKGTDISSASAFMLFNADQLVLPSRGAPIVGLAVDIITGKRVSQPAHDVLLATGILRGYDSPMWVNEKQLSLLSLKPPTSRPVLASTMRGVCIPLDCITNVQVLKELKRMLPPASQRGMAMSIFNGLAWERTISNLLTTGLKEHLVDGAVCREWVNIDECAILKPDVDFFIRPNAPRVDLAELSLRKFYNVCQFSAPHLVTSPNRSIAIWNGRLLGKKDETRLRAHSLKKKFSSPLWLTARTAESMGVGIKQGEKPIVLNRRSAGDVTVYNITDFVDPNDILRQFPMNTSASCHYVLDAGWKAVLGKQKQKLLNGTGKASKLWISSSEVIISGFNLKKGVEPTRLSESEPVAKGEDAEDVDEISAKVLFNSQQTTDPVRVIGLSPYYVRPQGTVV